MTTQTVTVERAQLERWISVLEYEKMAHNPLDWHHDRTLAAMKEALSAERDNPKDLLAQPAVEAKLKEKNSHE